MWDKGKGLKITSFDSILDNIRKNKTGASELNTVLRIASHLRYTWDKSLQPIFPPLHGTVIVSEWEGLNRSALQVQWRFGEYIYINIYIY